MGIWTEDRGGDGTHRVGHNLTRTLVQFGACCLLDLRKSNK